MTNHHKTTLALAAAEEREQIYRIRHQVYATELGQHPENAAGRLTDRLDSVNTYIVAKRGAEVRGFVAITPPSVEGYSIDKYFERAAVPVTFDAGLYEVRLLTVVPSARGTALAALLMYAAFRYCESQGAHTVVAIGRVELLDVYRRAGLHPLEKRVSSGAVTYELLSARVADLQQVAKPLEPIVRRMQRDRRWQIPGMAVSHCCYHGGAFFDAIGDEFDNLRRAETVISADVLDAWFPPAPSVIATLTEHLSFALRTSPPTHADGLRRLIARTRNVSPESILPGTGSSDLIFAALRTWVTRESRVLILDPTYGEYAHVLERVIGARVDRLTLARESDYDIDERRLADALARAYDWVVLVNPNNPTGRYLPGAALMKLLRSAPSTTRLWVDETYVEFTGGESIEPFAAKSTNVIVCKSMSKAYALSGARVGYLCGPPAMLHELRTVCPPWAVSLPAQIAACEALRAPEYYEARWRETATLRDALSVSLRRFGWDVVAGCANFVLCQLPADGPDASTMVRSARTRGLFLRAFAGTGQALDDRALRLAVKDEVTSRRIVAIIAEVLASHHDFNRSANRDQGRRHRAEADSNIPCTV